VLTDARAQHESDLAEISDELKKAKLGSLSLDLLAALLVGLSIGFTVAADWWAA
jgi:F0F1-type ATP synthase assembly protein I